LGYVFGWGNGRSSLKENHKYKPKTITVKGEKIELYEN
jgi:hypothetical protein